MFNYYHNNSIIKKLRARFKVFQSRGAIIISIATAGHVRINCTPQNNVIFIQVMLRN